MAIEIIRTEPILLKINSTDNISEEKAVSDKLLSLSALSFLFYLSLAFLIFYFFREEAILTIFDHGSPLLMQLLTGVIAGSLSALAISFIIKKKPVSDVLPDFHIIRAIADIHFSAFDRFQISLFAGIGEEILFRDAIQPLLGIWITSILFVGLHGYFKFKKPGHFLFGLMMFGLSMLLGILYEFSGLIAAITAHSVYDLMMLKQVESLKKLME